MADTEQTAISKINNGVQNISIESTQTDIKSLIYVVRNQQVMIDSDLAMLYQVETRVLNQAVKRNISRFPERFRFQLTKEEYENLKSQFVISSLEDDNGYGGRRKLPFVFTEQGIAMLSAVLHSDVAVRISIKIMDTFVEMRKYMANTSLLYERLNTMEIRQINFQTETDERFERVFKYISEHEESSQKVFFDGQIYDAFSLIVNLIQKADKEITLIDGYVDVGTLKIKYTKVFHDRFLIIDRMTAYHVGASLKDAGITRRFQFQSTKEEYKNQKSQVMISNKLQTQLYVRSHMKPAQSLYVLPQYCVQWKARYQIRLLLFLIYLPGKSGQIIFQGPPGQLNYIHWQYVS